MDPARDLSGQYDLVIASLSLTMHDIREAVQKMDAVSCGEVCLYWFVDLPFWERMYADLVVPLHGRPYYPGPKADCLWNVLYQTGIYANVEMLPLDKEYRFPSLEEMTAFFKKRFGVTTEKQERVLDAYLSPLYGKMARGCDLRHIDVCEDLVEKGKVSPGNGVRLLTGHPVFQGSASGAEPPGLVTPHP